MMKVLVTHEHTKPEAAFRHCWTLTQGGWQARVRMQGGKHIVEVGEWGGNNGRQAAGH